MTLLSDIKARKIINDYINQIYNFGVEISTTFEGSSIHL